MTRLAGKVAIVTGGCGGIGEATAFRLSQEGARVIVVDLDGDRAAETALRLPGDAVGVGADVSTEEGAQLSIDTALEKFGAADLHHLNAGIAGTPGVGLVDVTVQEWDRVMAVNVRGPFLGIRAAFRHYIATGTTGSIVVTASIASRRGAADVLAYSTSKHAVTGLVRGAAVYGGPIGVRGNSVAPGIVPTAIFGEAGRADMIARAATSPLRRAGDPEEIAAAVAFLLSDDAGYITGEMLAADGGAAIQNTNRPAGGAGRWDPAEIDQDLLSAFAAGGL